MGSGRPMSYLLLQGSRYSFDNAIHILNYFIHISHELPMHLAKIPISALLDDICNLRKALLHCEKINPCGLKALPGLLSICPGGFCLFESLHKVSQCFACRVKHVHTFIIDLISPQLFCAPNCILKSCRISLFSVRSDALSYMSNA